MDQLDLGAENKARFEQTIQSKSVVTDVDSRAERMRLESLNKELSALRRAYVDVAAQTAKHQARLANILTPDQAATYFAFVEAKREELERARICHLAAGVLSKA